MRVGTVAFLVALGGLASVLPKRMAQFSSMGKPTVSAEEKVGNMIEAEVAKRLEAQGVEGAAELARQARGDPKVIKNPLIDVFLGNKPASSAMPTLSAPSRPSLPTLPSRLPWRPSKDAALYLSSLATWGPVLLLGLAVVLAIVDLKGAARALVGLCHWTTSAWLILLAAAAPGLRFLWRVDVWGTLPGEFCWAPAAGVLVSAAFLRMLDLNEPVWNKTVLALSAPVVSGLAVPFLF